MTEALTFDYDLKHAPEKVWRAITDPELVSTWLLPVFDHTLEPGAKFTFKTQPQPGWDATMG